MFNYVIIDYYGYSKLFPTDKFNLLTNNNNK